MADDANDQKNARKDSLEDNLSVTQHAVTLGGQELRYTVTAGTLVLREEIEKQGDKAGVYGGEKPKATLFFIAYRLCCMNLLIDLAPPNPSGEIKSRDNCQA